MIYGSYYSPMMNNKFYAYEPVGMIGPKEKPKSNTGKILAGTTIVAGTVAAIQLARKGKLNSAKKAATNLFTTAKTKIKDCANSEKVAKYTNKAKNFFTEGMGKKVWDPIKSTYSWAKGKISKVATKATVNDAFAKMPKFNAYEYNTGEFNKFV